MTGVFRKHGVMAWRSGKTRLTSGNGRFADQAFALIKVALLFADMHNDLGRTGRAFIIPPACWSGAGIHARRIRWILLATEEEQSDKACSYGLQKTARVHWKRIFMRGSSRHSTLNVDFHRAHGRFGAPIPEAVAAASVANQRVI